MRRCLFCGHYTNADINHYHGAVSMVCKSTPENKVNCRSDWQNFKIKIRKNKNSKNLEIKEFAFLAEKMVFESGEPAIDWNRQLSLIIKRSRKKSQQLAKNKR